MKSKHILLAALLLVSVLVSGCVQQLPGTGGGTTDNRSGQTGQPPTAPPEAQIGLQLGIWSKVAMTSTSAKPIEFTYKSIEATIDGMVFSGIETEISTSNSAVLWEKGKDRSAAGIRMYSLSKIGQIVLCNPINTEPQNLPATADPYAKGGAGVTALGTGTYTTPAGKTVNVNKYKVNTSGMSGEYWYSSQVPFVMVKSEINTTVAGKEINTKIELRDFGTGATSVFKQADFGKCK